ncbi:MAG: hypothetical protein AB4080_04725 [Trichodesmium sp.]
MRIRRQLYWRQETGDNPPPPLPGGEQEGRQEARRRGVIISVK